MTYPLYPGAKFMSTHREVPPDRCRFRPELAPAGLFARFSRLQLSASQNMEVQMMHLLVSIRPGIGEDTEAGFGHTLRLCNGANGRKDAVEQLAVARGEVHDVAEVPFRDHEHVRGCLWPDIPEGKDQVILVHLRAGNLTVNDAAKNAIRQPVHLISRARSLAGLACPPISPFNPCQTILRLRGEFLRPCANQRLSCGPRVNWVRCLSRQRSRASSISRSTRRG